MPTVTANSDIYLVPPGAPYAGSSILANDSNTANYAMGAWIKTIPSHGTVLMNFDGTFVYTANADYTGPDQFDYWASALPDSTKPSATATLIVANVPPPGGNRSPVVAPIGARSDVEGRSPSVQVVAIDPDGNPITYAALQLPAGLTIDQNTGLISGKLTYASSGIYNVTVTVTDSLGAATPINFVWNVSDAAIDTFKGTEMNMGMVMPNSVTVAAITIQTLYLSPGNTLRLQVFAPPGGNLPLLNDILYSIDGSGASPAWGNFSGAAPNIFFSGAAPYTVKAGIDDNANGTLDAAEVSHDFFLRVIDFAGAVVGSQRVGSVGPVEPGLTTVMPSEHFETGAFFKFEIMGGMAGPTSMIRYEVWQSEWPNILLASGQGNSITKSFGPHAAWSCYVRFYDDKNNNASPDSGELYVDSPWFTVMNARVFNIKVDVSNAVGGSEAAAAAFAAGLQGRFNSARDLLLRKDSETDRRAAVQFNVVMQNPPVFASTNSAGARPDPVNDLADATKQWDADADVVFVNEITDDDSNTLGWTGNRDWHRIVVGYDNYFTGGALNEALMAEVIAHELGHGVGLAHTDPVDVAGRVMNRIANVANNEITQDEANNYDTASLWGQWFGSDPASRELSSPLNATPTSSAPTNAGRDSTRAGVTEFIGPTPFAPPLSPLFWAPIPLHESTSALVQIKAPILSVKHDWQGLPAVSRVTAHDPMDDFWGIPDPFDNAEGEPWNA